MGFFTPSTFTRKKLVAVMIASAGLGYLVSTFAVHKQLNPKLKSSSKKKKKKEETAKRLGRPLSSTNSYEDVIACDATNPDHIDVGFSSIGGLESEKQAISELTTLALKRPELFSNGGKLMSPSKGVLLYGPPGTGKTMLAKAIAKESGAVLINVKVSSLVSESYGESQKLVAAIFSLARKLQLAIIFIDEADGTLESLEGVKTEVMELWDGLTNDKNARVMVLGATNRPSELDEAILRRFTRAFEIGMPNRKERLEILKVILRGERVEDDIDFGHLASLSRGYSGSDLVNLCKEAAYFPIKEILDGEKNGNASNDSRPLSQQDLEKVLTTSKKTRTIAHEFSRMSERQASLSKEEANELSYYI